MAATDLFDLANEYLEIVVEAVASTPGGAISTAYVSPGVPAYDCEQITVHVGGFGEGDTAPLSPPLAIGQRAVDQGAVHLVNLTAIVLRCGATPDADGNISVSELEATSAVVDADVWAVWNLTRTRKRDGSFVPPDTRELIFDPALPISPEGGVYGWVIPIRVQLGGYSA